MKEFSLDKVPIYCLSYKGNDQRRQHILKLARVNKLNVKIIEGPPAGRLGKYEMGAMTFIHLILNHIKKVPFEPFVIIENDVSIYSRLFDKFSYPDDTDAIFIGITPCSVFPTGDGFPGSLTDVKLLKSEEFPHLFHDLNMLSTHGVFVTSFKYATHIADVCLHTIMTKQVPWDVPMARDKPLYNTFALGVPIFFQDINVSGESCTKLEFRESTITKDEFDAIKKAGVVEYFSPL